MAKKIKIIVLVKKKTQVEFRDVDGWMFELRYLTNGKETYSAQIIQPDCAGRIARLKAEGFIQEIVKASREEKKILTRSL